MAAHLRFWGRSHLSRVGLVGGHVKHCPTLAQLSLRSARCGVPAAVIATVGTDGRICIHTSAEADLIADESGYH